jgi:hypothetical protein
MCTKELVPQHAQLLWIEASVNIGRELPTESRAQQTPGSIRGIGEELLVLQEWEEGRMA